MKKTFLLAGFASILLACNINSNNNSANQDTSKHSNHDQNNSNNKNQSQMNPVIATMDKMMHQMHGDKPSGNNDKDFAAMMLEHHKGAVEMSKVIIEKGNDAALISFAQKVIDDQNKEMDFMQDFMSNASRSKSKNSVEFQNALKNSMATIMNKNATIYNDIDNDFATQMIPHHQSAVDMAKVYLQYGEEKRLTELCQNIVRSQEKEINWLKQWLLNKGLTD